MALSSRAHGVDVFYEHEGRYQHERAGLYKTSYDPKELAAAMNAEERGCGALGDTTALERGALDFPTTLNDDMAEVAGRCRALCGSVPRYHNMPSAYEFMRPYDIAKALQKSHLQPEPPSVGVRPQEGELVFTHETTYGGDYNTRRYLQENPYPIAMHARNEPYQVMSTVNQDLKQVRPFCRLPNQQAQGDEKPEVPCCDVKKKDTGSMRTLAANLLLLNCPSQEVTTPLAAAPQVLPRPNQDFSHRAKDVLLKPWPRCAKKERKPTSCASHGQMLLRFNEAYNSAGVPDLRRNQRTGKKHQFANNINSQVLRGSTIPQL